MKRVKKIIKKIIPTIILNIYNIYFINKTLLFKYGYLKSKKCSLPIRPDGSPIPWYTYPAIEFVDQLNLRSKNIFEYGCGNSSLFFAEKAKRVISVEDNKKWFDEIKNSKPENLTILFKD